MVGSLPRLLVRDASGNEREVEVSRVPFTMGRQSDNDLVLLDSRISRHHAKLFQDERGHLIEDTGSRHGTFVNNERITSCQLKSGDHISLGVTDAYQLTFVENRVALPQLLEQMGKVKESPAPQLQHLGLLLQMAQMLNRAPALEEVLTMLVDSAIQLTDAERGMLFLLDDTGELRLRLARGRGGVYIRTGLDNYSHAAIQRVVESGREEVVLEEEVTGRAANETAIVQGGVRGVVAVPLQKHPMMEMSGETITATAPELLGVLYLDSRSRATSLTGLDRQVLQTFAVEGATVIENARLFRITREQERMQYQFSLARNIQQGLLPRELPKSDFFQMHAITMPCQTVGGDYYDVIHLPGERYGLTVADVSGKGLPAAMLAAMLQGAFAAVAAGDPSLEELFGRVNDFLCERTPAEMFATIFYGVLDRFGRFNFVNAGHVTPLVARANGVVNRLDSSNFPLGFFPGIPFKVESIQLEYGDHLLIFSDGVTEAQDADDELYGETRLKEFLEGCTSQAASDLCGKVIAAVQDFVGAAPQADDLTLTVLRFGPS
jgi:serine phosphatase RsbU (regulator of sigma subunit)/pSer/pThr/pTyr-binding forkhead associated (FHA) protein